MGPPPYSQSLLDMPKQIKYELADLSGIPGMHTYSLLKPKKESQPYRDEMELLFQPRQTNILPLNAVHYLQLGPG